MFWVPYIHFFSICCMVWIGFIFLTMEWKTHLGLWIITIAASHQGHRTAHIRYHPYLKWFHQLFYNWRFAHMYGHHRIFYPCDKLVASKHIHNIYDTNKSSLVAYIVHISMAWTIYLWWIDLNWTRVQWSYFMTNMIGMSLIEDYFHRQMHLEYSYFERFHWFQQLRVCHWIHHKPHSNKNFAVLSLWMDWLLGTYEAPNIQTWMKSGLKQNSIFYRNHVKHSDNNVDNNVDKNSDEKQINTNSLN
jgi:hypothetical protein